MRSSRFYLTALAWTPRTIQRYKKEILRILAEVTLGSGALAVIEDLAVLLVAPLARGAEVSLR